MPISCNFLATRWKTKSNDLLALRSAIVAIFWHTACRDMPSLSPMVRGEMPARKQKYATICRASTTSARRDFDRIRSMGISVSSATRRITSLYILLHILGAFLVIYYRYGHSYPPFLVFTKNGYLNQMRIVETSPDRISERRAASECMIGRWRKSRRHLTRMTVKRRRIVALRRIDKERVFGGACHSTSLAGSSKYCPPSATTAHEGSAIACRS